MQSCRILNSRKRIVIALIHSLAFGLLAAFQTVTRYHPTSLVRATTGHLAGPIALSAIYLVVTLVLMALAVLSSGVLERCYFLCCSASATTGLLRVVFGDPTVDAGNVLRVAMLGGAVIIGTMMLRNERVDTSAAKQEA